MNESTTLTNRERRENVAFLVQAWSADGRGPAELLDGDERESFATGDSEKQTAVFFRLLCYGALAAQPAPEAVIEADWHRLETAGVVDALFAGEFELQSYALDPPVSRSDSKGKIIDFTRLSETRDTWSSLLPQPSDPDVAVDVLHASSGGALKSRAFWVVREMRRGGLWNDDALDRFACVPDGRVRKRAARMGLIDLPEKADTFADMKAVSRALRAVMRLGEAPAGALRPPDRYGRSTLRTVRCCTHGGVCDTALSPTARAERRIAARYGRRTASPSVRRPLAIVSSGRCRPTPGVTPAATGRTARPLAPLAGACHLTAASERCATCQTRRLRRMARVGLVCILRRAC